MVFHATPSAADAGSRAVEAPPTHVVDLTVYAGDSVAFGRLPLTANRVTDLMNDGAEFEFVDAYVQSLDDGHGLQVSSLVIARDEIFAVAVAGPRGDPRRRTRTRAFPVELRLGGYDVSGNLHALPGTDPIIGFRRRRAMVPLTEATISFDSPGGRKLLQVGTLLVNRDLTNWIAPASRSDVRPPEASPEIEGHHPDRSFTPRILVR